MSQLLRSVGPQWSGLLFAKLGGEFARSSENVAPSEKGGQRGLFWPVVQGVDPATSGILLGISPFHW